MAGLVALPLLQPRLFELRDLLGDPMKPGSVFSFFAKNGRVFAGVVSAKSNHRKVKTLQVHILACDPNKLASGELEAKEAQKQRVLIAFTSSLSIDDGTWTSIGTIPNWSQLDWFVSEHCYQTFDGRWHKAIYNLNLKRACEVDISEQEARKIPIERFLPGPALEKTIEFIMGNQTIS